MTKIEITEELFKNIANIRLQSINLPSQKKDDAILNETTRLERLYELYWIENLHNIEYYDGVITWVKDNYKNLINPNEILNDYVETKELSIMDNKLKLDDYNLII